MMSALFLVLSVSLLVSGLQGIGEATSEIKESPLCSLMEERLPDLCEVQVKIDPHYCQDHFSSCPRTCLRCKRPQKPPAPPRECKDLRTDCPRAMHSYGMDICREMSSYASMYCKSYCKLCNKR
uniref:Unknown 12C protein n=1 Tax=Calliactis polypus TaxID=656064 RepID=U12C_CALPY